MEELTIEKRFKSDPDKVFSLITEPENLLKWWGPEGVQIEEGKLDLSELGNWSSVMVNREGGRFKVTGEVVRLKKPNLVEFTWAWHDENDKRGEDTLVRFEVFNDSDGGCRFVLTHCELHNEESRQNHNIGWESSLTKLEAIAV